MAPCPAQPSQAVGLTKPRWVLAGLILDLTQVGARQVQLLLDYGTGSEADIDFNKSLQSGADIANAILS